MCHPCIDILWNVHLNIFHFILVYSLLYETKKIIYLEFTMKVHSCHFSMKFIINFNNHLVSFTNCHRWTRHLPKIYSVIVKKYDINVFVKKNSWPIYSNYSSFYTISWYAMRSIAVGNIFRTIKTSLKHFKKFKKVHSHQK